MSRIESPGAARADDAFDRALAGIIFDERYAEKRRRARAAIERAAAPPPVGDRDAAARPRPPARLRAVLRALGSGSEIAAHPPTLYALLDRCAVRDPELFPLLSSHLNGVVAAILCAGDGSWTQRQALAELDHGRAIGVVPLAEPGTGAEASEQGEAVWDRDCRRFLLRTPTTARPTPLPPVALDGPAIAVVAARLRVGERDEGLFPFVVTVRNAIGAAPGVVPTRASGPDTGTAIRFDRVALAPDALLGGGIASIDGDGRFRCEPTSPDERYQRVADRFQGSRVGRAGAAIAAARAGVWIACLLVSSRGRADGDSPVATLDRDSQWLVTATARLYAATALANAVRARLGTRRTSAGSDVTERQLLAMLATPLLFATAIGVLEDCLARTSHGEGRGHDRIRAYLDLAQRTAVAEGEARRLRVDAGRAALRLVPDMPRLAGADACGQWTERLRRREWALAAAAPPRRSETEADAHAAAFADAVAERLAAEALDGAAEQSPPEERRLVRMLADVNAREHPDGSQRELHALAPLLPKLVAPFMRS